MALLVLALAGLPAVAWGERGHRIVAEIAARRVDPRTAAAIAELLDGATLADVSFWADRARETPRYAWTRPLHYVNLPPDAAGYEPARDCPERLCVVAAVERFADELRDADLDRASRAAALRFLVHFVADVHAPLHVALAEDRGGNLIAVRFGGDETNLHRLWDGALIRPGDPVARAAALDAGLDEAEVARLRDSSPVVWADESWRLAHGHAYAVPADGVVDADYARRASDVIDDRLAAAGIRLAALLDRALSASR